ncbi:MAG TPA: hypothetical protein PKJ41_00825, partial [Bryobacteraceae bacterium]|nr:hypothetical protein [Bryobacteraceae bacterium]
MKRTGSQMKRLLVLVLLASAAVLALIHGFSYKGFSGPVFVEIPMGTSSFEIGKKLALAGV